MLLHYWFRLRVYVSLSSRCGKHPAGVFYCCLAWLRDLFLKGRSTDQSPQWIQTKGRNLESWALCARNVIHRRGISSLDLRTRISEASRDYTAVICIPYFSGRGGPLLWQTACQSVTSTLLHSFPLCREFCPLIWLLTCDTSAVVIDCLRMRKNWCLHVWSTDRRSDNVENVTRKQKRSSVRLAGGIIGIAEM